MEQKAKRIGKLNIIDLIAIVLIVAVLALAAWKFIGKNGDSISYDRPQTKVTYQVKVEGVAPELYENCQAHLPSPLMASGALVGGQIEAVEKETYQVLDANGNWVTDPDHVTLIFTVTTTTPTAEVMTTKVGDQEVRIGKTDYILKSEYIEFSDGYQCHLGRLTALSEGHTASSLCAFLFDKSFTQRKYESKGEFQLCIVRKRSHLI